MLWTRSTALLLALAGFGCQLCSGPATLSDEERTLATLKQVDGHPLFTMEFFGSYADLPDLQREEGRAAPAEPFACSMFFSRDPGGVPYVARNFDWDRHPALLLVCRPPDAFASISMVDISYLGIANAEDAKDPEKRKGLLRAPALPFDGMNEHGLCVTMAAVPEGKGPHDSSKATVGSIRLIRMMLDQARTVGDAVELARSVNVDFTGGPPIHYLVADRQGSSAILEFKDSRLYVLRGEKAQTNFPLVDGDPTSCLRYGRILRDLSDGKGALDHKAAFATLQAVAQKDTQWSILYDVGRGKAEVAMGGRFETKTAAALHGR
jgi:hypothetical protein